MANLLPKSLYYKWEAVTCYFSSFRPAPFFVLDEVDAALDNTNISKVSFFLHFISNRTPRIQCTLSKNCLITVG